MYYSYYNCRCVSRNSAGEVSRTLRLRLRSSSMSSSSSSSSQWRPRAEPELQVANLGANARIRCHLQDGQGERDAYY